MPEPSDAMDALADMVARTRDDEIDCDAFAAGVAELVEGTLPEERRALFEHHVRLCPDCAEHLHALKLALE